VKRVGFGMRRGRVQGVRGGGHSRLSCGSYGSCPWTAAWGHRLEGDLVSTLQRRAGKPSTAAGRQNLAEQGHHQTGTQTVRTDQDVRPHAHGSKSSGELNSAQLPTSQPAEGRSTYGGPSDSPPGRSWLLPGVRMRHAAHAILFLVGPSPRPGESGQDVARPSDDAPWPSPVPGLSPPQRFAITSSTKGVGLGGDPTGHC